MLYLIRRLPQSRNMKKVLIVDDKAEMRALLRATLDCCEIELLEAANGDAALELARATHPHLIILDVMMHGGLDGFEVCTQLKQDSATRDIFVLLLTARGQDTDKQRGFEAGAEDFFVKPFSPRELLAKVDEVLHFSTKSTA